LAALAALAVVSVLTACSASAVDRSAAKHHPRSTKLAKKPPAIRTFLGHDGVESTAVIAENKKPGTAVWRITSEGSGFVEGFAEENYAQQGEQVGLYVSTSHPSFQVIAYRMGWYQGVGARQIWKSATVPGVYQPQCPVQASTNMVSCDNWSLSMTMRITSAFVPGDYLLKLVAGDNAAYVPLTVWQPTSTATYLVMNRSLVEQGWNSFGGYDFYQGTGPCILDQKSYPPCNRARVVSFDRPYSGDGSSDFLTNEYPMVAFMEEEGLDVTYCTDICIDEHPSFVEQHKAVIDLDHDETWTNTEREAVLDAVNAGVNVAFFGAATFVRHARLQPSRLGPDREEVDYRDAAEDPLSNGGDPMEVTGNTWASPPTDWDSESFLGQIYSGYLEPGEPNAPMVVFDASSWFYAGTNLTSGSSIQSVINSDIDHLDPSGPFPQNLQVLAHSPIPLSEAYTNQGNWGRYTYSDTTYYTLPGSLAGVFDSGNNVWVATLQPCSASAPNCPAPIMRKLTGNVLRLFGQGPAGKLEPSEPNWSTVTPAGS
jgi:hypothetical protein